MDGTQGSVAVGGSGFIKLVAFTAAVILRLGSRLGFMSEDCGLCGHGPCLVTD
jgi:hypothetical protein